jgi:anthranilate phosphoribosyltransferase
MKKILNQLFEHQRLTREEAYETLTEITQGAANEAQIAAFLTVYLMRTISVDELDGFRQALLDLCVRLDMTGFETIDLCGTGGDSKNTFNISTLASFVVAGAGGRVAKHGNYGVSSVCGSSNVLEAMGYRFKNDESALCRELEEAGICFLHAPLFHPALKNVAPVRKALGIKTFFNMLGPLVNPAKPDCQMTGVFNLELLRLYGYLLQPGGRRFSIVHTLGGYDELSLTGPAKCITDQGEMTLLPEQFGGTVQEADLFGGDTVAEAADLFMKVLKNEGTPVQNRVVVANAALALNCLHPSESLEACVGLAKESLEGGRALGALQRLIKLQ